MTEFFEIFQPGLRHLREQRDLDKVFVVHDDQGGTGPQPLDLESGHVVIRVPEADPPPRDDGEQAPAPVDPASGPAADPASDPTADPASEQA